MGSILIRSAKLADPEKICCERLTCYAGMELLKK